MEKFLPTVIDYLGRNPTISVINMSYDQHGGAYLELSDQGKRISDPLITFFLHPVDEYLL